VARGFPPTSTLAAVATGDVWTFTASLPDKTANPYPTNGSINVTNSVVLRWGLVTNATSYWVYFNDSNVFQDDYHNRTPLPTTIPAHCCPATIYSWRVDSSNSSMTGVTTGTVWSFTTAAGPGSP